MPQNSDEHVVGLISDTHGLLRYGVHAAFAEVDFILHAGDVGGPDVLDDLATIAPTLAVYGNTDPVGVPGLERELVVQVGGVTLHVSHGHELGSPTPQALLAMYPQDIVVYGHTHEALVQWDGNRMVVNPGAAGPRRFHLRPSVARLTIANGRAHVEMVELEDD